MNKLISANKLALNAISKDDKSPQRMTFSKHFNRDAFQQKQYRLNVYWISYQEKKLSHQKVIGYKGWFRKSFSRKRTKIHEFILKWLPHQKANISNCKYPNTKEAVPSQHFFVVLVSLVSTHRAVTTSEVREEKKNNCRTLRRGRG